MVGAWVRFSRLAGGRESGRVREGVVTEFMHVIYPERDDQPVRVYQVEVPGVFYAFAVRETDMEFVSQQ